MDETKTRSTSVDGYEPFVDFKNLPDTSTPVDADNMNSLQIEMKKYIDNNRDIPIGGTTGQVLGKNSDSDYDVGWVDQINKTFLLNYAFPIGSIIYNASADFDPNTAYGGTWEKIKGRMIIGYNESDSDFNTLKSTGGSKTHTITINEMPAHTHNIKYGNYQTNVGTSGPQIYSNVENDIKTRATTSTGTGTAMNIMNPYYVANIWLRTA